MKNIVGFFTAMLLIAATHGVDAQEFQSNIPQNPSLEDAVVIKYQDPRPDDLMNSKVIWRMIDLREKINHPFYFPTVPSDGRMSLFTLVFRLLQDGKVNAYEYNESREIFTPQYAIPFNEIVQELDVIYDIKKDAKGDSIGVDISDVNIPTQEIYKFYVKEIWYFDKHESIMKVKILAICPQRYYIDPLLNKQEKSALFWIPFEQLRPHLAKQPVIINNTNNASRISYDDLFMKRRFGSYIYKESNIYNRSIVEYASTADEVKNEQNRIQQELLNSEQDLWEY